MTIGNAEVRERPAAGPAGCCGPAARADPAGGGALWGWSPPPRPADTAVQRRIDRLLPRTGLACALYFAAVLGLLKLAHALPAPGYLPVDGLAFLAAGGWCALNFWRRRHAHCLVSGAGGLALAAFAFVEAALGRSLIGGDEQLAFLALLAAALVFEGAWSLARGTNAVGGGGRATGR